MNKRDNQLINSIYQKLKKFKKDGLTITKKEIEDYFYLLINKN